jgi:DNA-binding NtrC family response regulator
MKGEDVMKKIMELRPDTRVIVSSGSPDEERLKMLIKLGAKAFIKKPYPFDKLLKLIREVLDKS